MMAGAHTDDSVCNRCAVSPAPESNQTPPEPVRNIHCSDKTSEIAFSSAWGTSPGSLLVGNRSINLA
ncbi:unnamed protein product [Boreogadus saida]